MGGHLTQGTHGTYPNQAAVLTTKGFSPCKGGSRRPEEPMGFWESVV